MIMMIRVANTTLTTNEKKKQKNKTKKKQNKKTKKGLGNYLKQI